MVRVQSLVSIWSGLPITIILATRPCIVCRHWSLCACVRACVRVCVCACACVCMCVQASLCGWVGVCARACVCLHACVHVFVCLRALRGACACVEICIHEAAPHRHPPIRLTESVYKVIIKIICRGTSALILGISRYAQALYTRANVMPTALVRETKLVSKEIA